MILSSRPRLRFLLLGLALIGGAALVWKINSNGLTVGETAHGETNPTITADRSQSGDEVVDLSDKQAATLKIAAVESRDFTLFKTAVGTIDFNENLLVQVFSQYPGKILKANFSIGDDVKVGEILFTIDSPDLLQAESTLLAAAGVLELEKRILARSINLLKTGGGAQKDVEQEIGRAHV